MKNFKIENQMVEYFIQQLNFEPNVALVISEEYLEELIDSVEFDCTSYSKEIYDGASSYLIDKYEDLKGNIHLSIEPLEFDLDGCLLTIIENDFVIVQRYLLDEEDIDGIYAEEEFEEVDYIEEDEQYPNEGCSGNCEECPCDSNEEVIDNECYNDNDIPEEVSELISAILKNIENGACSYCSLVNLYAIAFKDGRNSLALGLSGILNTIVEEKEE